MHTRLPSLKFTAGDRIKHCQSEGCSHGGFLGVRALTPVPSGRFLVFISGVTLRRPLLTSEPRLMADRRAAWLDASLPALEGLFSKNAPGLGGGGAGGGPLAV
jgi:hypothetical protein